MGTGCARLRLHSFIPLAAPAAPRTPTRPAAAKTRCRRCNIIRRGSCSRGDRGCPHAHSNSCSALFVLPPDALVA
jgi:hypothetical protein